MEARWGQHLPASTLDVGTENVDFSNMGKIMMKSCIVEEEPRTGGGGRGKRGTGDEAEPNVRGQGSHLGKRAIRSEEGSKDTNRAKATEIGNQ